MPQDHLSPVAPARIRVLVLPAGKIRRSRFQTFVSRIGACSTVPLTNVAPDPRQDHLTFSPLLFPDGVVLYDFVTSLPPQSHLELAPFELFRQPLIILGLADATEYLSPGELTSEPFTDGQYDSILAAESDIRTRYDQAILHKILLFDSTPESLPGDIQECTFSISPPDGESPLPSTELLATMQRLTSVILGEMADLVKKFRSTNSVGHISSRYFGSNPQGSLTQTQDVISQNPSAKYRLSMPVIANPAVDRLDSLKPTNSKSGSDRPLSLAGFSGSLFKSRSPSPSPTPTQAPPSAVMEKNRVNMVAGTLYLQAGSWSSALRELSDATVHAKQSGDMLWYCKGLENTVACLILLVWARVDFDLPQVILDKDPDKKRTANKPPGDVTPVKIGVSEETRVETIRVFSSILPSIVTFVINTYADLLSRGRITPLAFSESTIRLCKLLASLYISEGLLDKDATDYLVTGTRTQLNNPHIHFSSPLSRQDICHTLMNSISSQLSPVDYVMVLSGIATVLSLLQMHRKRAFILQELVTCLIPYLIQARKIGAAELGLHPAVGLASLSLPDQSSSGPDALQQEDSETGQSIGGFLAWVNLIYGVPSPTNPMMHHPLLENTAVTNNPPKTPFSAGAFMIDAQLSAFGGLGLKRDILKACINVCEALPDFQGALDFTSLLLRMLNPRFASSINTTLIAARGLREEQTRLWATVVRTLESAKNLGLTDICTEYWDMFLVRNIRIPEGPDHLALNPVEYSGLSSTTHPDLSNQMLLHNPWKKKASSDNLNNLLVEGEDKEFLVTLQNPYDIDIEIESISLSTTGIKFKSYGKAGMLNRRDTQDWAVIGTPLEPGQVTIIGCSVKVKGCRERTFPFFARGWHPHSSQKIKESGLVALPKIDRTVNSDIIAASHDSKDIPTAITLSLESVTQLPILAMTKVSCPQSALMILEGQKTTFSITLRNMSSLVAANFMLISFTDSVQDVIQNELAIPELPMSDVFELEHQLAVKPSIHLADKHFDTTMSIDPEKDHTFDFVVLGKPGLTDIMVKFSYSYVPRTDETKTNPVLMRHVNIPVSVTVNSSLQIPRVDIVPLSSGNPWVKNSSQDSLYVPDLPEFKAGPAFDSWMVKSEKYDYCLFNLDLRNTWPVPLIVTLKMMDWEPANSDRKYPLGLAEYRNPPTGDVYSMSQTIQPGHIIRMPFIVPRFYLSHQHTAIRHLIQDNEKQFTVSRLSISPDLERSHRQVFWYRDELLHLIQAEWKEIDSPNTDGRVGELDLRSIRLTKQMVDVLALNPVEISMRLVNEEEILADGDGAHKGEGSAGGSSVLLSSHPAATLSSVIKVDNLNVLYVYVQNRSNSPISGILRLQPRLRIRGSGGGGGSTLTTLPIALDLTRRLTYSGVLQHELQDIPPGKSAVVQMGLCALGFGEFEVGASFDKIYLPPGKYNTKTKKKKCTAGEEPVNGLDKRYTGTNEVDISQLLSLGDERKRSWVMNRPFRIWVQEEVGNSQ